MSTEPVSGSESAGHEGAPPVAERPVASPGSPEATAESQAANEGEPGKRRLRLNPTFDPAAIRPVPSLQTASSAAPAEPSPDAPPANPDAASPVAGKDEEVVAEAEQAVSHAGVAAPTTRPEPVDVPRTADLDAEMEAEIAAALQSGELEAVNAPPPTSEGEAPVTEETLADGAKLNGRIQSIDGDNVFLEFGLRMNGVLSLREFDPKKPPVVGQSVDVVVGKISEEEGLILCTLPRGTSRISGDWDALAVGQTVECLVTRTNKGGLEISVSSLRGFMPASQVDLGYVADLATFVGQKLRVRVTEVKPERRRLVVSRRQLLQEEREVSEAEMFGKLMPGQTYTGRVKTIKDYGAFVDLGGVDGLLHVGQISWQRINHPSDVIQEGQEIEVQVLSVDREKKKIGLGMRQLKQNPWANVEARYSKGAVVTGRVTRTEPFGAFIELEPGLEGLVHISELEHRRVNRVTEVLKVGQETQVQVLEVDPQKKRVSLSVKALIAKPESPKDEDLAPGADAPQYERKSKGPLRGGIGGSAASGLFGNPRDFS